MTDLEKLKHFMNPYYQETSDETLLNAYLTDYTYPECAAAKLWGELQGKLGLRTKGVLAVDTGAEKFSYPSPRTIQEACKTQSDYYQDRCNDILGVGQCAIEVEPVIVAGVSATFGRKNA